MLKRETKDHIKTDDEKNNQLASSKVLVVFGNMAFSALKIYFLATIDSLDHTALPIIAKSLFGSKTADVLSPHFQVDQGGPAQAPERGFNLNLTLTRRH